MTFAKRLLPALALLLASTSANASSPQAWAELYAKAEAQCLKSTNLVGSKVRGRPVDFADSVLLVIDGRHPQPHMKNAAGTMYCLFHKTTGKAESMEGGPETQPVAASPAKPAPPMGQTCWSVSFRAKLAKPQAIGSACRARNDEGDSYQGSVRR